MNSSGDNFDGAGRPRRPWVTFSLTLGFLAVFAVSGNGDGARAGELSSPALSLALLNHLLGHETGWLLAGNLWVLLWAAPTLERRYGSGLFALVLLAAGGFGGLVGELISPVAARPVFGAAGAVAGLVGAVSLRRPAGRISVLAFTHRDFSVPTWSVLPAWLSVEALRVLAGYGSVAASIGAFAFGVAASIALRRLELEGGANDDATRSSAPAPARTHPRVAGRSVRPRTAPETSETAGTKAADRQATVAPPPPASPPELPEVDLENSHPELDIDLPPPLLLPRFAEAKRVHAVPLSLGVGVLEIETKGEQRAQVALCKIQALAAAMVSAPPNRAPVAVVDLLLNWNENSGEPLHLIRLRSDDFDPRLLAPGCTKAIDALRSLLARLLDQTAAVPLPDADAARGAPFHRFDSFEHYERNVLDLGPEGDVP